MLASLSTHGARVEEARYGGDTHPHVWLLTEPITEFCKRGIGLLPEPLAYHFYSGPSTVGLTPPACDRGPIAPVRRRSCSNFSTTERLAPNRATNLRWETHLASWTRTMFSWRSSEEGCIPVSCRCRQVNRLARDLAGVYQFFEPPHVACKHWSSVFLHTKNL